MLRQIIKKQNGLTMIELIFSLVIAGFIMTVATRTTIQIMVITRQNNNHLEAVRQVQNAGYWISHDIHTEEEFNMTGGSFPITINWHDEWGTLHSVTYSLDGAGDLRRSSDEGTIVVANHIDPENTGFEIPSYGLDFNVTATVGQESETRTYKIISRLYIP